DPRAIEPLARLLGEGFNGPETRAALLGYGRAAESAVVPYLFHPVGEAHLTAKALLEAYGTPAAVVARQAAAELRGLDDTRRHRAAVWLAEARPDPGVRADVVDALLVGARRQTVPTRDAALRALAVWATADDIPTLARLLEPRTTLTQEQRREWVGRLAALRDPRAVPVLVRYLPDPAIRPAVTDALLALGPPA